MCKYYPHSIYTEFSFQEILTYSLTSIEVMKRLSPNLDLVDNIEPLKVANPMSRDLEYLRITLRPGVLTTLARNQRYQQKNLKLFELGKVFLPRPEDLPQEKEMLCAVLSGLPVEEFWRGDSEPIDFFIAKGLAETLLDQLSLNAEYVPGNDESLYTGKSAAIVVNRDTVGIVGQLHPKVISAFDITGDIFLVEFDIGKLLSVISGSYNYEPISKYPGIITASPTD